MSNAFEPGRILRSLKGQEIRIEALCSEGGLGAAYDVTVSGEKKILRWFKPGGRDLTDLWNKTREKMERGVPGAFVFWPEDMTECLETGFGYVIRPELRDSVPFRRLMEGNYAFPSWREAINVAINLVAAFSQLHRAGWCFDEHSADFCFSTRNGRVLFTETETIVPVGTEVRLCSMKRFCAPELLLGAGAPGVPADRYAMGIYLFCLFCGGHPLEGRRHLVPILTPEVERTLYAEEPLFLFDREDDANRPHAVIQRGVEGRWRALPPYIQELFCRLFDGQGLRAPDRRPSEEEWVRALCRMKNDRIACGCGNETFLADRETAVCSQCGKPLPRVARLVLPEYSVPLVKDRSIYRCQLGSCELSRMLEKLIKVVSNDRQTELLLKNTSGAEWTAYTPSGGRKLVGPDEVVPVRDGITFYIGDVELRIERK